LEATGMNQLIHTSPTLVLYQVGWEYHMLCGAIVRMHSI